MPAIIGVLLAFLALFAGCTAPNKVQPEKTTVAFRNTKAPIYSTANLPVARLIGTWRQVASFGPEKPCARPPAMQIAADGFGAALAKFDLCFGMQRAAGTAPLVSAGAQGRYLIAGFPAPLWVLWIDADTRSMVLGTPNGAFGMVVSKDAISPDRLRAAREVLAWNGYDLTQFHQY